jgi:OOP family OmpA-OmpF porin
MIHECSKTSLKIACALALAAMASAAFADPDAPGYVTTPAGSVVMSGTGLCVHADTGNTFVPGNPCTPQPAAAPVSELVPPAPAPVVVAQAPAAPPPAPVIARETFNADALFDFDKSTLRPAGQQVLDKFIGEVKGMNAETITALGYTDRIGTDAYNQQLSDRRAETVRAYMQEGGIEPGSIRAEGRGNTQPVTKPGECAGDRSEKVIDCLQPNRRVEVEVTGTAVAMASPN